MKYVIANWKMNMDSRDLAKWSGSFSKKYKEIKKDWRKRKIMEERWPKIVLCPSMIYIPAMCEIAQKVGVQIGSQDVSPFERGAHTGETGSFQIKNFCRYSIVGHSERGEPIEVVERKRDTCFKEGVTPIVCFVNPGDLIRLYKPGAIMAWEDPQNISKDGVYRAEDPEKISAIAKEIRKILPHDAPIVYGGSVNEKNISSISRISELDGALIGNASLDSEIFAAIIRYYI
ncbi:triose-phosphate isomerase [Patescibacteria group bacterium]|nr:triose-phosphate isomerase [Patescibacteria group bacterium]